MNYDIIGDAHGYPSAFTQEPCLQMRQSYRVRAKADAAHCPSSPRPLSVRCVRMLIMADIRFISLIVQPTGVSGESLRLPPSCAKFAGKVV